ncbi:MAG: hypothetical protein IH792_03720 [Thaumarchaeota archaeon]|nr:hypothetical protein [Nitrososphaerota archaeon]
MKLIQRITNSTLAKPTTLVSLVSILAVFGPFISVSGGFWDAVNHLVNEPEYFWSIQHMVVYFGVSLVASASLLSMILLIKKSVHGILKTGILLVVFGAVIQLIAGFVDSVSHDVYGIDGLISWSHQPLELGLVLAALGGFLVLKNREHTKLKILIPFSIISFLFFTTWLVFNFALIFGHTIQCIYIHVIFSSGCSIL